MHRSQNALSLALVLLAASSGGCGALINGTQQTITVKAADPKAEIFAGGAKIGTGSASVSGSPAMRPVVYVRDSTGAVARYEAESRVSVAAVLLDVLWCVTILGVAAPISDGLLGTFSGLSEPGEPIAAAPVQARRRVVEYAR